MHLALREKCPNTEFFLVRIFLYSDWIQENTDQAMLRIWTPFMQCWVELIWLNISIDGSQAIFFVVIEACFLSFISTLFLPMFPFWYLWKHQKTFGFLIYSGKWKGNIGKKRVKYEANNFKVLNMIVQVSETKTRKH